MIGYPIPPPGLEDRIRAAAPTWLARAAARTAACRALGRFDGGASIWSEIKPVFMAVQHNKCAYCERRLEGPPYGAIEHDVEHFRPKSGVAAWPGERVRRERGIRYRFATGAAWDEGYFLLAFHPRNYVTACKVCNTILKGNAFPIAGPRGPQADDPRALDAEQPLLIHPLDAGGADPERLLTFEGIVPRPRARSGPDRRRAVVTIDFFELDTREDLLRGRAEQLATLWLALALRDHPPPPEASSRARAEAIVARLQDAASPHANCVRSFVRLRRRDAARAEALAGGILDYLESGPPPAPA